MLESALALPGCCRNALRSPGNADLTVPASGAWEWFGGEVEMTGWPVILGL